MLHTWNTNRKKRTLVLDSICHSALVVNISTQCDILHWFQWTTKCVRNALRSFTFTSIVMKPQIVWLELIRFLYWIHLIKIIWYSSTEASKVFPFFHLFTMYVFQRFIGNSSDWLIMRSQHTKNVSLFLI